MSRAYFYVVDRDFGFAPNPFHGTCTLATCKPIIRRTIGLGDWVFGFGGSRLKATGRLIYAMEVNEKISFDDYWARQEFRNKKPVRNGSRCMLVGDNIYHREDERWIQADSHHSLDDGSPNQLNIDADTSTDSVLISRNFFYLGRGAVEIDQEILDRIGYRNGRNHRVFDLSQVMPIFDELASYKRNTVVDDPFDFEVASSRYTGVASKVR